MENRRSKIHLDVSEGTLQSDDQVQMFTVGYASSVSQSIGQVHLGIFAQVNLRIIFTP